MLIKNIITGNERDLHNEQIPVDELETIAYNLSKSERAVRLGLQHNPTIMPVGKVIGGKIVEYEKGHIGIEADIDIFIDEFDQISFDEKEVLFIGKSKIDSRPFMNQVTADGQKHCLMVNPLIVTGDDYSEIVRCIDQEDDFDLKELIQKSVFNDCQVWLSLAIGTLGVLTAKKTCNKLSNQISDDVVKAYEKVKKVLFNIAGKILCKKQTTYVISEPEQPIELVVIVSDAGELFKAFDVLENGEITLLYQKYNNYLRGEIDKIQFVYNSKEGVWVLNYIITCTGQVIGTYKAYNNAVKLFEKTMTSPTLGFSIGACREPTSQNNDE